MMFSTIVIRTMLENEKDKNKRKKIIKERHEKKRKTHNKLGSHNNTKLPLES